MTFMLPIRVSQFYLRTSVSFDVRQAKQVSGHGPVGVFSNRVAAMLGENHVAASLSK